MNAQYQIDIDKASFNINSHVYQFDNQCVNADMDISEIRRQNVLKLIEECDDSVKAFADKVGIQPGQASHLKTGFRNVGPNMAKRIEQAFDKESGWISRDHSQDEKVIAATIPEVILLINEIELALNARTLSLDTVKHLRSLVRSMQPSSNLNQGTEDSRERTISNLAKRIADPHGENISPPPPPKDAKGKQ
ncbi:hypothetical protein VA599_02870 [Chromobacterium sp. TRC.1.1.SA]|uniref:HTH cro/C1-type domain-containing protein n=1 Tax=Chromobacterium indicum TaxID=3110228 RepID=A0ABV0CEQ6_9NEIS